jgi:glucose-6-phosphate 1-epimerase
MTISLEQTGVEMRQTASGSRVLHLSCEAFDASIALTGGQLIAFTPEGGKPLLYLSPLAVESPGKAIRGGVPICWPWFGAHPQDSSAPQHGYARTAEWELVSLDRTAAGFDIVLQGPCHQDLAAEVRYRLGEGVTVELTTRNLGTESRRVSAALHTYLAVSNAETIGVQGIGGTRYFDKTTGKEGTHAIDVLTCSGEIDRIIYTTNPVELQDAGWNRTISIQSVGSGTTVLWNPGSEKSKAMKDLPDDGWQHFFCVESAIAGDDARTLSAGKMHTLGTQLQIKPL